MVGSDQDDESGPVFQDAKDWWVVIGDKDTTPALEMGVRFMKEGDEGLIYTRDKVGYGPQSRTYRASPGDPVYTLPPNSSLLYRVRLKQVLLDYSSPSLQLQVVQHKKQIGNDRYLQEWSGGHGMSKALYSYQKAADGATQLLVGKADQLTEEQKRQAESILLDSLNNVTAVYLKAKDYHKAKAAATEVLAKDPNNVKALLRAARAAMLDPASSYEETEAAIAAAEEVDPNNKDLQQLQNEFVRRKKAFQKKQKAMYAKMMAGTKERAANTTTAGPQKGEEEPDRKESQHGDTAPVVETIQTPANNDEEDAIEEISTPGVMQDKARDLPVQQQQQQELQGDDVAIAENEKDDQPKTIMQFLIKHKAYVFQLILPFITYSLFLLAQRLSVPPDNGEDPATTMNGGGMSSGQEQTFAQPGVLGGPDDEF